MSEEIVRALIYLLPTCYWIQKRIKWATAKYADGKEMEHFCNFSCFATIGDKGSITTNPQTSPGLRWKFSYIRVYDCGTTLELSLEYGKARYGAVSFEPSPQIISDWRDQSNNQRSQLTKSQSRCVVLEASKNLLRHSFPWRSVPDTRLPFVGLFGYPLTRQFGSLCYR